MEALSSNHFSHDQQVLDVLNWMETEFPNEFATLSIMFPEIAGSLIFSGSHFDTEAMGVEPEFSSWLADDIETVCPAVTWWEGEPWFDPHNELADVD